MSAAKTVTVLNLGRKSFTEALEIQMKCSRNLMFQTSVGKKCDLNPENFLLLVEHNPVYTIGIRRQGYSVEEENKLRALGAEFYKTNRGGLITYHGPGQLVAYPIIHLKYFHIGMRHYICMLEKAIIKTCNYFGIKSHAAVETGVWVEENKIAAIGVHGARYVTTHGLGLNCSTDLSWFEHITPCGIDGKGVTSLTKEANQTVSIDETLPPFLKAFSEEFKCSLVHKNYKELFSKLKMNT